MGPNFKSVKWTFTDLFTFFSLENGEKSGEKSGKNLSDILVVCSRLFVILVVCSRSFKTTSRFSKKAKYSKRLVATKALDAK